jgi:hypothetical protein
MCTESYDLKMFPFLLQERMKDIRIHIDTPRPSTSGFRCYSGKLRHAEDVKQETGEELQERDEKEEEEDDAEEDGHGGGGTPETTEAELYAGEGRHGGGGPPENAETEL